MSPALKMLASERPRTLGPLPAGAMLFGDWGTSRLYVLGLAFLVAGRTAFWLIMGMSLLIIAVGWAYTHICRLYPDGGGVYTAGKRRARILGVICALLLFADYTITASLSAVEAFHYFGLGSNAPAVVPMTSPSLTTQEAGDPNRQTPVGKKISGLEKDVTQVLAPSTQPSTQPTTAPSTTQKAIATLDPSQPTSRTPPPLPVVDDPGDRIKIPDMVTGEQAPLWTWPPSAGLYAIMAIGAIGIFNLFGPGHTAKYAIGAAIGMVGITVLVVAFAIPQIRWENLDFGSLSQHPAELWQGFVFIVLALSGVEAIANLTGVMQKPVYTTARRSIWPVTIEVAFFNVLLALIMISLASMTPEHAAIGRAEHKEDMLAYMASVYIGNWGEWLVRIVAGMLLLSATNTAVNGLMSILYVMSRDGEMPSFFQKLNSFGSPWVGALVAAGIPASVLLFFHDLESLAALYAIGVVGAVAIDCTLAGFHPRLRGRRQKTAIITLGVFLTLVWITLAFTKVYATIFVSIVLLGGLALRQGTQIARTRRPKASLLRQAIIDQLTPEAMSKPKFLLATAGGANNARTAIELAKREGAALVVCFVREAALDFRFGNNQSFTLDGDPAAEKMFTDFLELGHEFSVPIIPSYDVGTNSAEIIAEMAALNGVDKVLIGSSRRGALHQLIKGSFQRKLESLLPDSMPVQVLEPDNETLGISLPSS